MSFFENTAATLDLQVQYILHWDQNSRKCQKFNIFQILPYQKIEEIKLDVNMILAASETF